LFHISSMQH